MAENKASLKRGAELTDGATPWGPAALGPLFPASPETSLIYWDHSFLSPMPTGNTLLSLTLIALTEKKKGNIKA